MKKILLSLAAVVGLLAAGNVSSAAERGLVTADLPHEFIVAGNKLPAGHYEIIESDPNTNTLIVRNTGTGNTVIVGYGTRLAARPDKQPVIVFDKEGEQEYLSEIHVGSEDGYYFSGATGKHTHVTVKATKKS